MVMIVVDITIAGVMSSSATRSMIMVTLASKPKCRIGWKFDRQTMPKPAISASAEYTIGWPTMRTTFEDGALLVAGARAAAR